MYYETFSAYLNNELKYDKEKYDVSKILMEVHVIETISRKIHFIYYLSRGIIIV
jgi:hypothetical protein